MSKPKGLIRCRTHPVAAQVRAMLPQFWGISGSWSTTFSKMIYLGKNSARKGAYVLYDKSFPKSTPKNGIFTTFTG
jgi:hypothetical protein